MEEIAPRPGDGDTMDPSNLGPGSIIADRFELECMAGSGGAGVVFRARDQLTGAPVALKILPPESTAHAGGRMQREAQALAALRHPRIVGYIAHGRILQERTFLAMEWLEGEDLRRYLLRRRPTVQESLLLVRAVAEGLAEVHRQGLVHRDIKPSNLFLRDGRIGRIVVIDFGLARSQGLGWSLTQSGQIVGTLCYMAPEQVLGQRHVGPSADIFALGCVLYECLIGRPLFEGHHLMDALARVSYDDPLQFFHTWSGGPGEPSSQVMDLLRRMLAKDPAARLADGDALLAALEELAPGDALAVAEEETSPSLFVEADAQHLMTFILAVPRLLLADPEATWSEGADKPYWAEVESLMKLYRTRLTLLANGIFIVSLTRTNLNPADQAGYMARLSLMLKERLPDRAMAVITVRVAAVGVQPAGQALWLGAEILRQGQLAEAGEEQLSLVWLDELTARLLDTRFQVRRLREEAYVLEAERSDLDPQRLLLGRPTPCVGREHELFLLEAILNSVCEDLVARVVLVLALPGEGKSRLRHEFVRRLGIARSGVEVLFGRADPARMGAPYVLLERALLGLCHLLGRTGAGEVPREQFRERVVRHGAEADRQRIVEFLGELCGLPFPDDRSPQLRAARQDPRLMSEQCEAAWVDFLRAECAVHPVLLVLEDLHWADVATVRLVDVALRELSDRPFMVLALARPDVKENFPRLWTGRNVQEVRLTGLPRKACMRLAQEMLGERATNAVVEQLVRHAGGNALFLEELIRGIAEGAQGETPATVLAMIEARLWRLEPEARRVLRVASLFGETFWRGGVRALLGGADRVGEELDHWLASLVADELIVPHGTSRFQGDPEFGFRHALLREAALGTLGEGDRLMGHRLAAEYLERQGDPDPLVLAEHYERGAMRDRAASLYAKGAMQTLGQSDIEASLRSVERGVACGATGETLGLLRSIQAWAYFWRLDPVAARTTGQMALATLPEGSIPYYMALGITLGASWSLGEADLIDQALHVLVDSEPPPVARPAVLESALMVLSALSVQGKREGTLALLRQMEKLTAGLGDNEARSRGQMQLMRAVWQLHLGGDPYEQYRAAAAAMAAFSMAGDQRLLGIVEIYLGSSMLQLGDESAWAVLRQALARGERLQEGIIVGEGRLHLALGLAERGEAEQLAEARQQAMAILDPMRLSFRERALAHAVLAEVWAREGAWAAAEEEIRRALAISPPGFAVQPMMFAILAEVLRRQGRLADAVGAAREGLARLGRLGGSCWNDIKLSVAATEVFLQAGLREEAQETTRAAGRLLRERMARFPEEAMRERYLTRVPHNARAFELLHLIT
jgi:tetratricopeptide (TPR) repeat protein